MTTSSHHPYFGLSEDHLQDYWETQTHEDLITIKSFGKESTNSIPLNIEIDRFIETTQKRIDRMISRMLSDQQRLRNIANDISVQDSFRFLQRTYPKLNEFFFALQQKRIHYESLKEKLERLRDTRQALNVVRTNQFTQLDKRFEQKTNFNLQ